ncbi:ATP-binding protein [Leucothrix pacifica]|uniref:AAA family ATPase n=1 Tax=Leucothrix pacifica TaxID=1247513 RepID=A0A317CBA6_9GAMM|nr:ATP-binding protein [Leucothrix pacifica]PWQ95421.1 AAA family ATPase [Leucothrix pacifica]
MFIQRLLADEIIEKLSYERSKIVVIYGARQVGKTTLVEHILDKTDYKTLRVDGDEAIYNDVLSSQDSTKLGYLVQGYDLIFIDEAQRIKNIGINLKILHEKFKHLKIIVTGSSSLDLANQIKEPLTGRTHTYRLYPISWMELAERHNPFELQTKLEERLIYGHYPEVFQLEGQVDKVEYLRHLSSDYLYRDVLELENIRHSHKLRDLLKLLAFQVGSEVSYSEIGTQLGLSRHTVADYIDLLEKSFVLITLRGFSRNLRKEISKKPKIYFYDLGIRNSLIDNFAWLNSRNDIGALWENFLIMERLKRNEYSKHYCSSYFWRTYTGAELDYIEEFNGELWGYEFKWSKNKPNAPKAWVDNYDGQYECVNKNNFLPFVLQHMAHTTGSTDHDH